jgi:molybdopterin-guanine dinucleotide biosynthesis protein A
MLVRAADILRKMFGETVIVTNQEIPHDVCAELIDTKIIHDEIPHLGPLGGISAALKASKFEIAFVMAVDMPFVSAQAIERFSKLTDFRDIIAGSVDVVVPVSEIGFEPLFAFYHKRCLAVIDKKLAAGERKVVSIFDSLNIRTIDIEKLKTGASHRGDGAAVGLEKTFININTESELKQAEELKKS